MTSASMHVLIELVTTSIKFPTQLSERSLSKDRRERNVPFTFEQAVSPTVPVLTEPVVFRLL